MFNFWKSLSAFSLKEWRAWLAFAKGAAHATYQTHFGDEIQNHKKGSPQ
jgi:hypothetical protein